jgi:hypothetical protein
MILQKFIIFSLIDHYYIFFVRLWLFDGVLTIILMAGTITILATHYYGRNMFIWKSAILYFVQDFSFVWLILFLILQLFIQLKIHICISNKGTVSFSFELTQIFYFLFIIINDVGIKDVT